MESYVAGLLFSQTEEQVALILKDHPAWQAGKLNAVGGHFEDGETPAEAMIREFEEESGVRIQLWEPFARLFGPGVDGKGFEVFFFRSTLVQADVTFKTASEQVSWYHVYEVNLFNTIPNIPWFVQMAHPRCRHDWPYTVQETIIHDCWNYTFHGARGLARPPKSGKI